MRRALHLLLATCVLFAPSCAMFEPDVERIQVLVDELEAANQRAYDLDAALAKAKRSGDVRVEKLQELENELARVQQYADGLLTDLHTAEQALQQKAAAVADTFGVSAITRPIAGVATLAGIAFLRARAKKREVIK